MEQNKDQSGAAVRGEAVAREYFYKVDACKADDGKSSECICWHKEGTGPLANRAHEVKHWRPDSPVSARAADALDSQPTEPDGLPPLPEPIEVGGEGWDFDDFKSEKTFSCEHMWAYARAAIASSQPTDGGVRND